MIVCQIVSFTEQPSEELMKRHRRFLRDQGENKKLMMSGRFSDKWGALILWRVDSIKEARELATKDPFFQNQMTTFILKEWNMTWDFTKTPPVHPKLD